MDYKKLDNPVWHSLNETHKHYAITFNNTKCYDPDYCPFLSSSTSTNNPDDINSYAKLVTNFFSVGTKPTYNNTVYLNKELVCIQMIIDHKIEINTKETIIKLNTQHYKVLFDLVNLIQPGYFKPKTATLGNYYGIFKDNKLVAVTGERMKMNDFTEISAVITHPDHGGNGYAKQLVAYTSNQIIEENKIPYLHVAATNTGAIGLYKKLGFRTRREISFWNLIKQ